MTAALAQFDHLLRGTIYRSRGWLSARVMIIGTTAAAMGYGAVMGCFGLTGGADRIWQVVFSASKVPLLLVVTFALCVPSFFVFNTLAGLRNDFGQSLRALLITQCSLTLVLLSLAPLTAFWYASDGSYERAVLFNAVMFAVASLTAQRVLKREYAPLIAQNLRHRIMLRAWLVTYAFVGIQMGWVLRPFIGKPGLPVRFFRADAWGNAYQEVLQLVIRQLGG